MPAAARLDLTAAQVLRDRLQARLAPTPLPLALDWSAEWEQAAELADPECAPLLAACRAYAGGGLAPIVGYELANATGRVLGQAELAWEPQRLAVFLDEADPSRDVFAHAGWRTFAARETEAIVDGLRGVA